MTDLGVALGLHHLSPRGFARVLELPPIHQEGRLVWGLTGRAGPAGVLKGGDKSFFLGCGAAKCPSMQEWLLTCDFGKPSPAF